jgi:hypothetical protein
MLTQCDRSGGSLGHVSPKPSSCRECCNWNENVWTYVYVYIRIYVHTVFLSFKLNFFFQRSFGHISCVKEFEFHPSRFFSSKRHAVRLVCLAEKRKNHVVTRSIAMQHHWSTICVSLCCRLFSFLFLRKRSMVRFHH